MSNVLEEKVTTEDAELYAEIKSWLVDHRRVTGSALDMGQT